MSVIDMVDRLAVAKLATSMIIDPDCTHVTEHGVLMVECLGDLSGPVNGLLTAKRVRVLRHDAPETYDEMAERNGWPEG